MAIDLLYGTANQTVTITIASLTNNSLRESTAVSNTSNKFFDVILGGKIKSAAASTSSTGYVNIYVYGSADGGSTYSGDATGTDAAYTGKSTNLILLARIDMTANSTTYKWGGIALSSVFVTIPSSWGIVIENKTGATLDATGSNHAVHYQGVSVENV